MTAHAIHLARQVVDRYPTDPQKEAGNYRKGHIRLHGLDITIENPKGSVRSGVDPNGKRWSCKLPTDYGYIKRTEGADGDHVDVYLGPDHESPLVFVINQIDRKSGRFDEHKVMLAYRSEKDALKDYCAAFSDGHGSDRIGSIEPMTLHSFKDWLRNEDTTRRASSKAMVQKALSFVRGVR